MSKEQVAPDTRGVAVDVLTTVDLAGEIEWAKVSQVLPDDYPAAAAGRERPPSCSGATTGAGGVDGGDCGGVDGAGSPPPPPPSFFSRGCTKAGSGGSDCGVA